jgi:hypothetical protein
MPMTPAIRHHGGTMKLARRNLLHLTASAAVLPVIPRAAWAQTARLQRR